MTPRYVRKYCDGRGDGRRHGRRDRSGASPTGRGAGGHREAWSEGGRHRHPSALAKARAPHGRSCATGSTAPSCAIDRRGGGARAGRSARRGAYKLPSAARVSSISMMSGRDSERRREKTRHRWRGSPRPCIGQRAARRLWKIIARSSTTAFCAADVLLVQRPADALHRAALESGLRRSRMDRLAGVLDRRCSAGRPPAGFRVDLDIEMWVPKPAPAPRRVQRRRAPAIGPPVLPAMARRSRPATGLELAGVGAIRRSGAVLPIQPRPQRWTPRSSRRARTAGPTRPAPPRWSPCRWRRSRGCRR